MIDRNWRAKCGDVAAQALMMVAEHFVARVDAGVWLVIFRNDIARQMARCSETNES
jgi:hypothetical protein